MARASWVLVPVLNNVLFQLVEISGVLGFAVGVLES